MAQHYAWPIKNAQGVMGFYESRSKTFKCNNIAKTQPKTNSVIFLNDNKLQFTYLNV